MRAILISLLVACSSPAPASRAPVPPPLTLVEREELKARGLAAYERKDWRTCAATLERVEDWYDAACCRAQAGELELAFGALHRAIGAGLRDAAHIERDTDLAPLHGDPRWKTTLAEITAKAAAYRATLNGELLDLYEADQGDRKVPFEQIDWKVVSARDEARRKRVDEILTAGGAKVPDDYYHAAMVYQHGSTPAEIRRAKELSLRAVALDANHDRAKWLAAASEDRICMYENRPQKYGTQYKKQEGTWVLWQVDPTTTDEERAKWKVPPLAAAKARAEQMNAAKE